MEPQKQNFKTFLLNQEIIFFALLAFPVMFASAEIYLVNFGGKETSPELGDVFIYIVPAIVLGGIIASNFLFKQLLGQAKNKKLVPEKLRGLYSAYMVRYALLEGPAFFSIVAYLLTGNLILIGVAAIPISVFVTLKPSKDRLISDLELDHKEQAQLDDPNLMI